MRSRPGKRGAGGLGAKLLSVAVSLALCVGLCPAYATTVAEADESSLFDSALEQLVAISEAAVQRVEDAGGDVTALFDASAYSSSSSGIMLLSANAAYPETYDLRDYDYVTSVKFQNPWGTCWSFGSVNAAETSIIAESDGYYTADSLDLSELQLAWFANMALPEDAEDYSSQAGEGTHWLTDDGTGTLVDADDTVGNERLNSGGTPVLSTSVFASGIGPLFEEYAPYEGEGSSQYVFDSDGHWYWDTDGDWSLDEEIRYWYSFELEDSNILPEAAENNSEGVEAIKSEIMEGRATTVAFCADQSMPGQAASSVYINPNTWAHYTYDDGVADHLVSIVGWDDTYNRYLFCPELTTEDGELDSQYFVDGDVSKGLNAEGQAIADASDRIPDTDGAWIVKNSWGSTDSESPNYDDWGIDGSGYFYLSYWDKSMTMVETYDFDLQASEDETDDVIIDQYDLMTVSNYGALSASTMEGIDEISMANVFTASDGQIIRAVGVTTTSPDTTAEVQVYLLDDDSTSPTDGTPVLDAPATATFEYGGFHRIELRDYGVVDEDFIVAEGQQYSVVVTLTADDDSYVTTGMACSENDPVEIEDGVYWYSEGVVNEGESYMGLLETGAETCDWGDWVDMVELLEMLVPEIEYDNLPVKAYSDPLTITVSTADELEAALDSVIDGYTIVLDADITVDDQIVIDKDITLDLGGYTLTNSYAPTASRGTALYSLVASVDGVTIQNGTYMASGSDAAGIVGSAGDLTLLEVTVDAVATGVCSSAEGGILTIEGCTISGRDAVGSIGDGNKVVVSDSTLTGEFAGVVSAAEGGTLTIEDSNLFGAYGAFFYDIGSTVSISNSGLTGTYCGLYRSITAYDTGTAAASSSAFSLTATDSTFIGEGASSGYFTTGVCIAGTAETYAAVGCHQASFDNCAIIGDTGIEVQYTDLRLTDCAVAATQDEVYYEQGASGTVTYGFAVVSTDNSAVGETPNPVGTITIMGDSGNYTGRIGLTGFVEEAYPDFEDAAYVISGGYFTWEFPEAYLAIGYELVSEDEGFRVQPAAYSYWTLAFETNGGSAVESVTVEDGATVDLSAYSTTRDGYTFSGWYADSDLTNQVTSITLTADATVYAGWTQDSADSGDSGSDGSSTDGSDSDGSSTDGSDSDGSTDGSDEGDSADSTLAKTGDETPWAPLCVLVALAGCVLAGAVIARKRLARK